MDFHEIIVTPDAAADLAELRDYIANVLNVPDIARECIQHIREKIDTLALMPCRYTLVNAEPWRSRGVRRMNVRNFVIYYRIDETNTRIYILNVIYNRRDQLQALSGKE